MKRTLILVTGLSLILALLAGCGSYAPRADDTSEPLNLVPVGSRVVVNEFAPIREGTAGVWAQAGKWVDRGSLIDHYSPFCRFEIWELVGRDEGVRPGDFRVESVSRERTIAGFLPYNRVAQVIDPNSEGVTYIHIEQVMKLRSDAQPGVYLLRCGSWELPNDADGISIDEIRATAGSLFSLEI